MSEMIFLQFFVGKPGIQKCAQATYELIEFWVPRDGKPMHGIVSDDEKPDAEERLYRDVKQPHPVFKVHGGNAINQVAEPACDN